MTPIKHFTKAKPNKTVKKGGKTNEPVKPGNKYAKAGQPTKIAILYEKKEIVELMYRRGFTDAEVAAILGVTVRTLENWKVKDPDFFHALTDWKIGADGKVEAALYDRACGFSHPDVHISNYMGDITQTPITKHYPPDTTACIFWLKNRKRMEWRDKHDFSHDIGEETLSAIFRGLPAELRKAVIDESKRSVPSKPR